PSRPQMTYNILHQWLNGPGISGSGQIAASIPVESLRLLNAKVQMVLILVRRQLRILIWIDLPLCVCRSYLDTGRSFPPIYRTMFVGARWAVGATFTWRFEHT